MTDNKTAGIYISEDGDEFGPDECNGSGRCTVSVHVHGCYSDRGTCDEPEGHEAGGWRG